MRSRTLLVLLISACVESPLAAQLTISMPDVRWLEPNNVYPIQKYMDVKIDGDLAATLVNVHGRLFVNQTLTQAKDGYVLKLASGCEVKKARVILLKDPVPSFNTPIVRLRGDWFSDADFRCGANNRITKTNFVLVIENADTPTSALQLDPSQKERYFMHAYPFKIEPDAHPCPPRFTQPKRTIPVTVGVVHADTAKGASMADTTNSCVTEVK